MQATSGRTETGEPWRPGWPSDPPGGRRLGSVRDRFEAFGDCVADAVDAVRWRIADLRDNGIDNMKGDVVDYTRAQPANALLAAAAVGAVVGLLLGLRRR